MDFATTEAASRFIKLVSVVCPCTATDRVPRANRGPPQPTLTSAPSSRPRLTPKKAQKPVPSQPKKVAGTQARPRSVISAGSDDSHTLSSGSSDPLPEALPVHNSLAPQLTSGQTFPSSFILPPTPSQNEVSSQPAIPRPFPPSQTVSSQYPDSFFISDASSHHPNHTSVSPSTWHATSNALPDAFLESLMQSPTLYDLSKPQLEAVVAQVIREEGFIKLVCVCLQPRFIS
jgi:hypothetical protein